MRVQLPPVAPSRSVRQQESRGLQNRGCRAGAGANPAVPATRPISPDEPPGHGGAWSPRLPRTEENAGSSPAGHPPARGETDDHGSLRSCSRRFESSRADQKDAAGARERSSRLSTGRLRVRIPSSAPVCEGASGATDPDAPTEGWPSGLRHPSRTGSPFGDVSPNLTPSSRFTSAATGSAPGPEPGGAGSKPAS